MKIGIWIPSVRQMARPEVIRRSITVAEQLGYDSIWTIDHVITPRADVVQFGVLYDPLVVMSLAAGLTEPIAPEQRAPETYDAPHGDGAP